MAASVPWRFAGTGTSSNRISASPSIVAWQARTKSPSWLPWGSTSPDTTRTRQVSHWPEQQSCGISMRAASPASTRVSPRLTRSCLPLTVRVHLSPMINRLSQIEGRRRRTAGSVHDDPHRSHVAGMAGLGVVEHRDPHEQVLADDERDVELRAGVEGTHRLEGPVAVLPLRAAVDVAAVVGVVVGDDHARDDGAERDLGVELRRVGIALLRRHPPAGALEIDAVGVVAEAGGVGSVGGK